MEKEMHISEAPECRFFVQDTIIENLHGIEVGMMRNDTKYGIKIPNEYKSEILGKIDFSTLTHREIIIGGILSTIYSELQDTSN